VLYVGVKIIIIIFWRKDLVAGWKCAHGVQRCFCGGAEAGRVACSSAVAGRKMLTNPSA